MSQADVHRFRSRLGDHLLVLRGSQVLDDPGGSALDSADALSPWLAYGASLRLEQIPSVPPQSLSLNLTSSCNLGCDYCYADRGSFSGRQSGAMTLETARAAIEALFSRCERSARATIGFLGGEPMLQRSLLADIVRHAAERADALGQPLAFSITTNGTLIEPPDLELFRAHPFAVTISLDGGAAVHDKRRLTIAGKPTHADVVRRVRALLDDPGQAHVTARATITSGELELASRLDALAAAGFRSIGFSPVRVGQGALSSSDWPEWQTELVALGERELQAILRGGDTPFDNLRIAMRQIHRGHSAPYPCGAGGGYFSVSSKGEWYACHRAIGDSAFRMGDSTALDHDKRNDFLREHHVEHVPGCSSCWARYLCSGACHQEASARSLASCDAIRAWLEFCLDAYCTLSTARPEWLSAPGRIRHGE